MKTSKKILYALTMAFVMFFNIFAGCTLIGTNTTKYYNTVVATAGDDIKITKYQLMSAYNNYGSTYVNSYGLSVEEAYERLLNEIIDSEVLVKYVEDNYSTIFGAEDLYDYEKSEIWSDVFDYVNNTEYLSYVNQLRKNAGLEEISTSDSDESSETLYIRESYSRTINIFRDAHTGEIVKITQMPATHDVNAKLTKESFKFTYFGTQNELEQKINDQAKKQFMFYLSESSEEKNLSDERLVSDHLDTLYKNYRKSYLTAKFQEHYTENKEISINAILDKCATLMKADQQKYLGDKEGYIKAVQGDASSVYYHPYSDELIYVSHILVKYDYKNTDYNLKEVYKTQFENGQITEKDYLSKISDNNLGNNCAVYEIVDGKFAEEPLAMNANELYELVSDDINSIRNNDEKLDKFLDYAYQYNQDTGMFSSKDNYTVQLDTAYADTMVKEFADLSRELYNTQGAGSIGICFTQYGAHIIYVIGVVGNKIKNNVRDNTLSEITVDQLEKIYVRDGYDKTMLDVLADLVKTDDYSSYEDLVIEQAKHDLESNGSQIVINKDKYKDLYQ